MILLCILALVALSFGETLSLDIRKASQIALEGNRELIRLKREINSLEDLYMFRKAERFMPKLNALIDKESFSLLGEILLLDLGNRLALIESQRLRLEIKRELLRELERQVKIRLTQLFMKLALAEKKAEVAREDMAVTYVRFDRERERLKQGLSNRVEVARWESKYRENRARLLEAQREYNETYTEIKRFLGLPLDRDIEVNLDSLLDFKVLEEKTLSTEAILRGLNNNYLVKIKGLEIKYLEARAKGEKRVLYPELYAYFEVKNRFGSNSDSFKGSANLVLRTPLFDGKASFYRFRSFLELRRAVEVERKDILETLKRRAMVAPYDWDELVAKYQDARTYDKWAMENLDLSRSNYELELAFDLGYAMSTKTEAERRVMKAKFEIILYLMRLYDMLGLDPLLIFEGKPNLFKDRVEEL